MPQWALIGRGRRALVLHLGRVDGYGRVHCTVAFIKDRDYTGNTQTFERMKEIVNGVFHEGTSSASASSTTSPPLAISVQEQSETVE